MFSSPLTKEALILIIQKEFLNFLLANLATKLLKVRIEVIGARPLRDV